MSNVNEAKNGQAVQEEKLVAQPEQSAEKIASPVKQQTKVTESDVGTGEESRDSVQSAGQESAEGDEDDDAGDEEVTDDEYTQQLEGVNGAKKSGEEKPINGAEKAEEKKCINGAEKPGEEKGINGAEKAEARKRIINDGQIDVDNESSQQKKQRMDGEKAAEKEVAAE